MTVIRASEGALGPENRPDWCLTPRAGYFELAKEGGEHDCHYHEYNELYLIGRGKAKIWIDGVESYVQAGDIVCIHAGDEHDILEIYGDEGPGAVLALRAERARGTIRSPPPKPRKGEAPSRPGAARAAGLPALTTLRRAVRHPVER
jgi:hypothetical protein